MNPKPLQLPKLLALDLDGTLLPESKKITPYSREILGRLTELGCKVTVATGKFHHLALEYGQILELDLPQISHDGAIVGGNGHAPAHRCIPLGTAKNILETYQKAATHVFADDGNDTMLLRAPTESFCHAVRNWADATNHVDDPAAYLRGDSAIITFYGQDEPMREIAEDAESRWSGLRVTRYWSEYLGCRRITFQPNGVDKGTGVLEVARQIGALPAECLVFGDWLNDLSMFQVGAVSVAMTNGVEQVRSAADYETEFSNEEDGVARFLEKHFL